MEPLAGQVAGHNSLLVHSPTTVAKPCPPTERTFYDRLFNASSDNHLDAVRALVPRYQGALPREDPAVAVLADSTKFTDVLVLDNLVAHLNAPCITDIKLGFVLYDAAADPAKRAKMERLAAATTNGSVGLRFSGMRLATTPPIVHSKEFGKALTADTIDDGFVELTRGAGSAPRDRALVARAVATRMRAFLDAIRPVPGHFVGTSALIVYDASPQPLLEQSLGEAIAASVRVHWIDFAHSELLLSDAGSGADPQFLRGLENAVAAAERAASLFESQCLLA
ncbi:hypothetical protein BC828DRAFT_377834 [Blastocladiella britannica]|nr:hypothetical protein BC828DRAFT_377834 [Blastocladiella britannica]